MKSMKLKTMVFGFLLSSALAFAQHGHVGGGMGSGMGNLGNSSAAGHETSADSHSTLRSAHGNALNEVLMNDSKLADKISTLTGQPATQACSGFRNLGQCVAAAHVAKNLDLNFNCLKSDMTGTAPPASASCPAGTGAKGMSLGKAIQTLDPTADDKAESRKAQSEAQQDLKKS